MKVIISFLFLFLSLTSESAQMSEVFGEGAFNTKWGNSLSDLKKIYPKGRVKEYVGIVNYEINDGRKILGSERNKNSIIRFSFDTEDRLQAITANFDTDEYSHLFSKLNTLFGKNIPANLDSNYTVIKWPIDGDIEISLMMLPSGFGSETVFMIQYFGLDRLDLSKEELGF
jgi:hypothetical protein